MSKPKQNAYDIFFTCCFSTVDPRYSLGSIRIRYMWFLSHQKRQDYRKRIGYVSRKLYHLLDHLDQLCIRIFKLQGNIIHQLSDGKMKLPGLSRKFFYIHWKKLISSISHYLLKNIYDTTFSTGFSIGFCVIFLYSWIRPACILDFIKSVGMPALGLKQKLTFISQVLASNSLINTCVYSL